MGDSSAAAAILTAGSRRHIKKWRIRGIRPMPRLRTAVGMLPFTSAKPFTSLFRFSGSASVLTMLPPSPPLPTELTMSIRLAAVVGLAGLAGLAPFARLTIADVPAKPAGLRFVVKIDPKQVGAKPESARGVV